MRQVCPLADIWRLLEQTDDAECRRVISMTRAPTREQPAHEKNLRDVGPIPIKVRPEVLGGESSCTGKPYIPVREIRTAARRLRYRLPPIYATDRLIYVPEIAGTDGLQELQILAGDATMSRWRF